MLYAIIYGVALIISIIALLAGFGLGTVLTAIFALFFPLPWAIAFIAIVHFFNNFYNLFLVGKYANRNVVIKFGVTAALAALIGSYLLIYFSKFGVLYSYKFFGFDSTITLLGLLVGFIVLTSSFFVLAPKLTHLAIDPKYIPLGGLLSGFFGGFAGTQGILRSAFLIKAGLSKKEFVGTGTICAFIVDISRLLVYGLTLFRNQLDTLSDYKILLIVTTLITFLGSTIAYKLLNKMAFSHLKIIVGVMLFILGWAILLGVGKG